MERNLKIRIKEKLNKIEKMIEEENNKEEIEKERDKLDKMLKEYLKDI